MLPPRHLRIADFTYPLPDDRIARYPLPERDASKLLTYRNAHIEDRAFRDLPELLPAGTTLVFNNTQVVPARLVFTKDTGGTVEVFCLEPDARYADVPVALSQRGSVFWRCLVGGAAKWKPGLALHLKRDVTVLQATWTERAGGEFGVHFTWNHPEWTFAEVLQHFGAIPLPPYLNRTADASDAERYQTVFARQAGSVAAPTASLHFTENILAALQGRGVQSLYATLHVGAGTFQPVKSETLDDHPMHAEWLEVDAAFIRGLLDGLPTGIVAVGTTALRTVESLYWIGRKLASGLPVDFSGLAVTQWEPYETQGPEIPVEAALQALLEHLAQTGANLVTRTQILIAPGYRFRVVRGLITNFHQPQSTLLLLVAALIGADWKRVYDHALEHGYRFLSYGDSSLLWATA